MYREPDFERSDAQVTEETVSTSKSIGLDVNGADIEELVVDQREELPVEELSQLQSKQ